MLVAIVNGLDELVDVKAHQIGLSERADLHRGRLDSLLPEFQACSSQRTRTPSRVSLFWFERRSHLLKASLSWTIF